jgi:23S rRNA (pseudouridine1915-N3)-methyltransferase
VKLHIVARGKMGRGAEADLIARYVRRITWPFEITELPNTGGNAPALDSGIRVIALDEAGEALSSPALAAILGKWRDSGIRECRFYIGAADGLTAAERASADLLLSFGAATWPHMMVRAMLTEQLYRATAIIAGHPYHRDAPNS